MQLFKRQRRAPDNARKVETVRDFLFSVSVAGNTGKFLKRFPNDPIRFMEDTMCVVFPKFEESNPGLMKLSTFKAIRRRYAPYIKYRNMAPRSGCRYCENFRLRLQALWFHRQELQRRGAQDRCTCAACSQGLLALPKYNLPKDALVRSLVCPRDAKEPWWTLIPCALGKCGGDCGLRNSVSTLLCPREEKIEVIWKAWVPVEVGKQKVWRVTAQAPVSAKTFWDDTVHFADTACGGGATLRVGVGWIRHLIIARSQHEARRELLVRLKEVDDECLIGCDFARQYEFYHNHIIPECSFSSEKATIFVSYVVLRVDGQLRMESYFYITNGELNNAKQNPGFSEHCLQLLLSTLKDRGHSMRRVHLFSDGEFREKAHLAWMGSTAKQRRSEMIWNFCGPNHGKDIYDGEGGVLKCSARRYVREHGTKDSNPIDSVAKLVQFGKDHLANPKGGGVARRHFFEVNHTVPEPPSSQSTLRARFEETHTQRWAHQSCIPGDPADTERWRLDL